MKLTEGNPMSTSFLKLEGIHQFPICQRASAASIHCRRASKIKFRPRRDIRWWLSWMSTSFLKLEGIHQFPICQRASAASIHCRRASKIKFRPRRDIRWWLSWFQDISSTFPPFYRKTWLYFIHCHYYYFFVRTKLKFIDATILC